MKLLQYPDDCHPKNRQSMERMCKVMGIEFSATNEFGRCYDPSVDILWFPMRWVSPDEFPGKKILYGPHHFVFPEGQVVGQRNPEWSSRCVYTSLSDWNTSVYREFACDSRIPFTPLSFGLNPEIEDARDHPKSLDCVVYFKRRKREDLEHVRRCLEDRGLTYRVFSYGSYSNSDYIEAVKSAKFCIWLGCHESQGFAFQECLASNVPILCWDATSMFQETNPDGTSVYEYLRGQKLLAATSASSWSHECGIKVTDRSQIKLAIDTMLRLYRTFTPRSYIYNHLSDEVTMLAILRALGLPTSLSCA